MAQRNTKPIKTVCQHYMLISFLLLVVSLNLTLSHEGDVETADNNAGGSARPTKSVKHNVTNRITPTSTQPQRLLLISLDGFRHDFLDIHSAPTLTKLASDGVKAKSLTASYVTKTFPNHHTLATGLYEETHGIIANRMYDSEFNEGFNHCSTPACGKWYGGEPIWNSNELNNGDESRKRSRYRRHGGASHTEQVTRRSGVVYWPGASASINNMNVTHDIPYLSSDSKGYLTLRNRFDIILDWFSDDTDPINLGVVYYESPDRECHTYGPESAEVS